MDHETVSAASRLRRVARSKGYTVIQRKGGWRGETMVHPRETYFYLLAGSRFVNGNGEIPETLIQLLDNLPYAGEWVKQDDAERRALRSAQRIKGGSHE